MTLKSLPQIIQCQIVDLLQFMNYVTETAYQRALYEAYQAPLIDRIACYVTARMLEIDTIITCISA